MLILFASQLSHIPYCRVFSVLKTVISHVLSSFYLMWESKSGPCYSIFRSDQIRSIAQSCPTLCRACQASLSITNSRSSLRLTSIELAMPSSHLILCCALLLLPPNPPSIRVFSNESTLRTRGQSIGVSASASVLPVQFSCSEVSDSL